MKNLTLISVMAALCFTASAFGALLVAYTTATQGTNTLGSAVENTFNEIPIATNVNVGSDVSTLVVATNTARQYLRITNNSTSSDQGLYCNTNDRAAVADSGFALYASSSLEFTLDKMYRGAFRCIFAGATSSVTVVEK